MNRDEVIQSIAEYHAAILLEEIGTHGRKKHPELKLVDIMEHRLIDAILDFQQNKTYPMKARKVQK